MDDNGIRQRGEIVSPQNKHSWQVHRSAHILEMKCKGRLPHISFVVLVIQPPVGRKKIARHWRRSSRQEGRMN